MIEVYLQYHVSNPLISVLVGYDTLSIIVLVRLRLNVLVNVLVGSYTIAISVLVRFISHVINPLEVVLDGGPYLCVYV